MGQDVAIEIGLRYSTSGVDTLGYTTYRRTRVVRYMGRLAIEKLGSICLQGNAEGSGTRYVERVINFRDIHSGLACGHTHVFGVRVFTWVVWFFVVYFSFFDRLVARVVDLRLQGRYGSDHGQLCVTFYHRSCHQRMGRAFQEFFRPHQTWRRWTYTLQSSL